MCVCVCVCVLYARSTFVKPVHQTALMSGGDGGGTGLLITVIVPADTTRCGQLSICSTCCFHLVWLISSLFFFLTSFDFWFPLPAGTSRARVRAYEASKRKRETTCNKRQQVKTKKTLVPSLDWMQRLDEKKEKTKKTMLERTVRRKGLAEVRPMLWNVFNLLAALECCRKTKKMHALGWKEPSETCRLSFSPSILVWKRFFWILSSSALCRSLLIWSKRKHLQHHFHHWEDYPHCPHTTKGTRESLFVRRDHQQRLLGTTTQTNLNLDSAG